ncbi:flavin reductase [Geomicrobium sediminis]|uniref:Flavin reductase (DIM6/NTAB) family NADH-FMN oxidoreductase RutF/DNA-binding FadR family transcriptional regulator n=1 Tax=Geomicrobium sediminis TaxID=1347788 RepID=A0ABS2PA68_9BACL|nr:flavin reductase [Geomicrobium sediminis]MBM7632280.1 flavin reductase (DIM6/NTAB) family NADH-FMN oxidoreductase RutF/DNA-binding FadR family transcriptional regulator [Geomicrobium sediminis]
MDQSVYKDVIGHFTSGVTVISTRHNDQDFGITASAVSSLSMEPPKLLVCVNKNTGTQHAISESQSFAVNILAEEQGDLALQFAKPKSNKFQNVQISDGRLNMPVLSDALAVLECEVDEEVNGGTHSVFLAKVIHASSNHGDPLTYYRGQFGRFQNSQDQIVYRNLRKLVVERNFDVKSVMNVQAIHEQLEAPKQTVYYALAKLESEGILEKTNDGGFVVAPLTKTRLHEALDTRAALEFAAIEKAIKRVTTDELQLLNYHLQRTLHNELEVSESHIEANADFHDYIVSLAKNDMLLHTYRQLTAEAVMTHALHASLLADDVKVKTQLNALSHDHETLYQAFLTKNSEKAKETIQHHADGVKQLGDAVIEQAGGHI